MKKLVVAIVVLAVLAGGAYAAFMVFYNPEAQRAALEQRLSEAFGRPAKVGPMSLTILPSLGVEVREVRVERDPSFGEGPFLTVDRVHASLDTWEYLVHRRPAIDDLVLEQPRLTFVKREDGTWNFSTLGSGVAVATHDARAARGALMLAAAQGLPSLTAAARETPSHIEAKNAEVTLVDRTVSPATEVTYKGIALVADVEPAEGGYRTNGRITSDSAAAGGEPLAADLPFEGMLTPPGDLPVWRAKGTVPSGALATRNFKLDTIKSDFTLDEAQLLRFAPLNVGLYGGTFDGEASLDLSTKNNRFRAAGRAAGVSLGPALAAQPEFGGTLDGKLDAEFDVTGELGGFNYTLASLGGGGRVAIADARLTSVNLLAEISQQGGFQRIEFDEPGTHAERIEAALQFGGGRATFEQARVENVNDYADLTVESGFIALASPATIQLEGSATILPALFEKVAQADPVAGSIARLVQAGSQITVPLTVTGSIDKPSVSVQWGRVLNLPFGF